jgi:hypothetical protein
MRHLYKTNYFHFVIVLIVGILFLPGPATAQDTLYVEWWDDNAEEIIINALLTAIEEDTDRPPGRVYKLQRGGFYVITETIEAPDFHLRLVGEPAGTEEWEHPPLLQMYRREDGSNAGRLITVGQDLTLKNLYILGNDDTGDQGSYQPIRITGSGGRQVIDNVIFERSNFAIPAWDGANNTIIVTNSVFRNLIPVADNQKWTGRGFSAWNDQDTVIVENNTFFLVNMTAVQIEGGAANYFRFNRNTLVNIGRNFLTGSWWRNAYVANNLLINTWWHGEDSSDFPPDRDPRSTHGGMMGIGGLPTKYGPEAGRKILFANNHAWRDPKFQQFYGNDIVPAWFIGPAVREDYFDVYDGMVVQDTVWLPQRPNMPTYFDDDLFDAMWDYITNVRSTPAAAEPYFWMLPEHPITGDVLHTGVRWPLPEDFSYTDATLLTAGTDGLPLGDLNWFPAQLSTFEANKAQYVADLHAMIDVPTLVVEGAAEAEDGTLGGDAEIVEFGGALPYFKMEGGGFIRWEFEMEEAATIELVITTRSQDGMRGQHVRVNNVGLRNDAGFGEYMWYDLDLEEWQDYLITQADIIEGAEALEVDAGTNTIELAPSWGWQEFLQVQVLVDGTVVHTLNSGNVTEFDLVQLISPVVIPHFRMEGGGFIRWEFEMEDAATVDLIIVTRSQDAVRGEHVRVNGVGLRNDAGYGEYMWFDLDPEEWKEYLITQDDLIAGAEALDLDAGTNTVEIAHSWGWQEFLMVKVLINDEVVHELTSLNVTEFEIVTIVSEFGPPPSGFKSVDLGGAGTITWNFNVPESENYALNVFYQAPHGTQTGAISVGGTQVGTIELTGEEGVLDILSKMSSVFFLTEGVQEITLSGQNVLVDLVQLVKVIGVSVPWDDGVLPHTYNLYQNFPNPFNPTTTIQYRIGQVDNVVLKIYNILGQEVKTLVNEVQHPGTYRVAFDASTLASGIYFYRLEAGNFIEIKKMVFIK